MGAKRAQTTLRECLTTVPKCHLAAISIDNHQKGEEFHFDDAAAKEQAIGRNAL